MNSEGPKQTSDYQLHRRTLGLINSDVYLITYESISKTGLNCIDAINKADQKLINILIHK